MSAPRFELDRRAQPGRAVRAMAVARLDYAIGGLAAGDALGVHEARKVCKQLRGLLRLVQPQLGGAYRDENARLRDAGRALSKGREATVLVETADALFARDAELAEVARLVRRRPRPRGDLPLLEARAQLEAARRHAADWPLRDLSAGDLLVRLLAGYRRARRGWREARRRPTVLVLHEWRKQAKYHGYQCALVAPLWPAARARIPQLKKLSDVLGRHHDLHVLAMALRRNAVTHVPPELARLARRRIGGEQGHAARQALKLGRALFMKEPMAWLEAPYVA